MRGLTSFSALRFGTKLLTLARLAFIARFIAPSEIGAYQLALLVVAVGEVFTETGINIMLLKHPKKLDEYLDTAWVVSIARGALIGGVVLLLVSSITDFYGNPNLATYLIFAALVPFFRGFINPAVISYQQNLQFARESGFRLGLQLLDIISGAFLAWYLQSAIGLIIGLLIGVFGEVVFSFILFNQVPHPLKAKFSLVVKLYQETKFIIGNGILHYLTENLDDFVIGKVFGTVGLGLYHTAYRLASSVTNEFGSIVGQILYPIYAKRHAQREKVAPLVVKSSLLMLVFYSVISIPLLLFTPLVVRVVLGENWLETVPLVRLLFVAGAVKSFTTSWNPLALLANKLSHYVAVNVITIVTMVGGILWFAVPLGVAGAGVAVLIAVGIVQPYVWAITYASVQKLDHAS